MDGETDRITDWHRSTFIEFITALHLNLKDKIDLLNSIWSMDQYELVISVIAFKFTLNCQKELILHPFLRVENLPILWEILYMTWMTVKLVKIVDLMTIPAG